MFVLANRQAQAGVDRAIQVVEEGGSALDAIEQGLNLAEADPTSRFTGYGGAPDMTGEVTCDAAIMDGNNRQGGAVGAVRGYLKTISLARKVMETLPHVMLVGNGAERFAAESGFERQEMLSPEAKIGYETWLRTRVAPEDREKWPEVKLLDYVWPAQDPKHKKDTSVFVVQDRSGRIASGTTTSGWSYKYPGRLGDSPILGAGLYADSDVGGCVCTHTGEVTIRGATAHTVVLAMRLGKNLEEACQFAAQDLKRLQGGYLGPVVMHAADKDGNISVYYTSPTSEFDDNLFPERPAYYFWKSGMKGSDLREAKRA